ncbi:MULTISPECIES: hypothetical protein [Lactococcus]|uniref:hypothetical protein n=1 Tax=Lactococcus TaxID=1357 RepID=UPI00243557AB|nr:hypothetical protein [Lactococcus formosensis]MDG6143771.1 hypothetical protein [Lactococcus formosensis]
MKSTYTHDELVSILAEFLDQIDDSVPEQQGGYDLDNERWLSEFERIEKFINHDSKILNQRV